MVTATKHLDIDTHRQVLDHRVVRRATETCPPGMKTGDAISPPGGFVGGNMNESVDVAIDPAGNVWVTNNWRDIGGVEKARSHFNALRRYRRTEFYGMAKPGSTPQIGPPRQP